MPTNKDKEVLGPMDTEPSEMTQEQRDREENIALRENQTMLLDRISRLENIQNQNKLRKYDEMNDPESLRKEARIPSFDGKDPIIAIERAGKSWIDDQNTVHDEQYFDITTLEQGKLKKKFTLLEFNAAASGNSIMCVINDWDTLMEKQRKLNKMYHDFQKSSGKAAKIDTVSLLKEIKSFSKEITVNVTLSEDLGKTFKGKTIDVPWQDVLNAIT